MLFILAALYLIFGIFSETVWRRVEEDKWPDIPPPRFSTSMIRVLLWPLGWYFFMQSGLDD